MIGKSNKLEGMPKLGSPVPSYTPELGRRISLAIEQVGGLRVAAAFTGASEDSLANWRDGKARPSFFGIQGLAEAAGVSLDWIATGKGEPNVPTEPLDESLMQMVVEELERFREERHLYWDAERKARLITLGYAMMLAERADGKEYNARGLRFMLKAAS